MRGGIGSDPEVARIIDETRAIDVRSPPRRAPRGHPDPAVADGCRGWLGFCEATSLDWIERRAVERAQIRDLMLEVLLATIPIATRGSLVAMPATPQGAEAAASGSPGVSR